MSQDSNFHTDCCETIYVKMTLRLQKQEEEKERHGYA